MRRLDDGQGLQGERFGWGVALCSIAAFAIVGMALFLCAWSAKADGYARKS